MNLLCRGHHLLKHATGSELVQPAPGIFRWRTPAGLQYQTRSEPPLILDPNQLAGIPKPPNPDADLIKAGLLDADHGGEQLSLTVEDILLPEDIDDPDNLPIPR